MFVLKPQVRMSKPLRMSCENEQLNIMSLPFLSFDPVTLSESPSLSTSFGLNFMVKLYCMQKKKCSHFKLAQVLNEHFY